jgi:DNA gyrase inhibitor GyrI
LLTYIRRVSNLWRSRHERQQNPNYSTRCLQRNYQCYPRISSRHLPYRGDPNLIGNSVRKFIEWRKQNNLPPQVSDTFNILYDNPSETSAEDFRLDICASTQRDVTDNSFGVVEKTIPGGRCAVLRYIGDEANLGESITYLYSNWLPLSGEEPRDFPLFLLRYEVHKGSP